MEDQPSVGRSPGETLDPFAAADEAGLVYVNPAMPGITRERLEKGWRYRHPDGTLIDDPAEQGRIDAIRVEIEIVIAEGCYIIAHLAHKPEFGGLLQK